VSIEEQLAELLARLGVVLEEAGGPRQDQNVGAGARPQTGDDEAELPDIGGETCPIPLPARARDHLIGAPDMSLFQTSREHYGVFYRLDLVDGLPQLRVFLPEDMGALKMRCYVICAGEISPLRDWFESAHLYEGSLAFDDARDITRQHLLFAAGELMKKLFWSGEMSTMRFPDEIEVLRVA
jgi:hypothetical protein